MVDLLTRLQAALSGRYTIERELARGGMAVVFLAPDLKHDRPVAIKVLRPDLAAALGAERFLREIQTAARLQHPNILPLCDSAEAEGSLILSPASPWRSSPQARFIFFSSAVNLGCERRVVNRNEPLIPYTAPARSS